MSSTPETDFNVFRNFGTSTKSEQVDRTDQISKTKTVQDLFLDRIQCVCTPSEQVSVDEEMVLWCICLVFKHYVQNERHRYIIKVYMLSESGTGYTWNWIVYTGQMSSMPGYGHAE